MPNKLAVCTILLLLGAFTEFVSGGNCFGKKKPKVFLGYNGFSGQKREKVIASKPSELLELGAVFYVADSVDVARGFSGEGRDSHICFIYADEAKWAAQDKAWIEIDKYPSKMAIDAAEPHAVLFADHKFGRIPKDKKPAYQMGIRENEIATLTVTADCHKATEAMFTDNHDRLNYWDKRAEWHIRTVKYPSDVSKSKTKDSSVVKKQWDALRAALRWIYSS